MNNPNKIIMTINAHCKNCNKIVWGFFKSQEEYDSFVCKECIKNPFKFSGIFSTVKEYSYECEDI